MVPCTQCNMVLLFSCSCNFHGTREDLEEHLKQCKFENMKEFIQRTEERVSDLQCSLSQKEQEIGFLRTMLGKLSEKLDRLEKFVEFKVGKKICLTSVYIFDSYYYKGKGVQFVSICQHCLLNLLLLKLSLKYL